MKNKPAKYGIKIWWAVDSETWYPLNVQVYLGKPPNETREVNQGQRVANDLTRKWLNKFRIVIADNFCTSIPLVTELLAMKAIYKGTIRKNKAEIPREFFISQN